MYVELSFITEQILPQNNKLNSKYSIDHFFLNTYVRIYSMPIDCVVTYHSVDDAYK